MATGAFEVPGFKYTRLTAADLSTHQYKFVDIDATGKVNLPGAGGRALAVLQGKPGSGQAAELMFSGISKVVAGGAITAGDGLKVDASGRVVTAGADPDVVGIALMAASGANIVISVLFGFGGGAATGAGGQGVAVADVAAMTQAAITGGESPTEAEFNALRADVAAIRTTVNALLASLRTAEVIAT